MGRPRLVEGDIMKRRLMLAIGLLLVLSMSLDGWTQGEGTPSNEELLAAMDAARFLDSDTGYVVQVMEIHAEYTCNKIGVDL